MSDLRYPLVPRDNEPQFDTTEIRVLGRADPIDYLRICAHANALPVISGDEIVAHLCIDCDAQLPAWRA